MVCESKVLKAYGIKVWGLSEAWKELKYVQVRLRKKLMGIPNPADGGFV